MNYSDYFKDWEFNHLETRAHQFGLEEKKVLEKAGQKTVNKNQTSPQINDLNQALERLAEINKFSAICHRDQCSICEKLENIHRLEMMEDGVPLEKIKSNKGEEWELKLELWRWQKKCKDLWWENNFQGIVKVITGAGKTIFALSLISKLKNMDIYEDYNLKVIVIVPSTTLLSQWKEEFKENLHLQEDNIGVYYGRKKDDFSQNDVMIYVVNSARDKLGDHLNEAKQKENFDTFLIADECHRYASKENSKIFDQSFDYKIGLSATPERQGDYGFENILVPNLGEVIYRYGYDQALEDNVISPYQLYRVSIELTGDEMDRYENLTDKAGKLFNELKETYPQLNQGNVIKKLGQISREVDDPNVTRYTALLNKRKGIVHKANNRFKAVKWLFKNKIEYDNKVLVFHERIEDADKVYKFLEKNNFSVGRFHSKVDRNRQDIIDDFRKDNIKILVTCKALDEGFDLPRIDTGIIASATASIRQRIQRIGRVLRMAPGKYNSSIYTIYVRGIEDSIFNTFEMRDMKGAANEMKNFHLSF